jgi:hypothetical protein
MDEQNVVYTYNGIFLIIKEEENSDISYNIEATEDMRLSEISQTQNSIPATGEMQVGASRTEGSPGKSLRPYLKNKLKTKGLRKWLES